MSHVQRGHGCVVCAFMHFISFMATSAQVCTCPIQTLPTPPGDRPLLAGPDAQVCVKTGYANKDDVFCVKIAGGGGSFAGNTGMLQVFSQKTLRLQCLLQDEGILTEMRTAAAACLASSVLMPKHVAAVGLIGGSVQAIWHLRFLTAILPATVRKVVLRTRSQGSAAAFREKMRSSPCALDREWEIVTYEEEEKAGNSRPFAQCALIHTVSCARTPVLTPDDLAGRAPTACKAPPSTFVFVRPSSHGRSWMRRQLCGRMVGGVAHDA
jgi:ornithine cyclodeaminase/alanine dehydrogenase-like protein (mu-crystallin family)